jgi:hypothetical protein
VFRQSQSQFGRINHRDRIECNAETIKVLGLTYLSGSSTA